MADVTRYGQPVTFENGLLESQEPSVVPTKFATELLNWVPEPHGGLRARAKWNVGSTTDAPTTRRNRGIGMFSRLTDPSIRQSTNVVTTEASGGGTKTPIMTWPTPTVVGNIIVGVVHFIGPSFGGISSFTATGWTARQALPTTLANTGAATYSNAVGVYELVTTQSYSGDVTPFSYNSASGINGSITQMKLYELQGASSFDKVSTSTSQIASGTTTSNPITVTTATTAQASELELAFAGVWRFANSNRNFTLSGSSTWVQHSQHFVDAANLFANTTTFRYALDTHYRVTRATEAASITFTPTYTNDTSDMNGNFGVVVTYRGWNSSAAGLLEDTTNLMLAANDDGTNVDVYSIPREDLDAGAYTSIDANAATSTQVAFTLGLSNAWYSGSTFSAVRKFDGSTASAVTGSPAGARCLAVHKARLWAGAGTRLSYSQVNDGTVWTGRGSSYFDVGKDDGEYIEDITPFAGGLVVGKRTSAHYLVGDTPDTFALVQLNAGGAAPGRSVLTTPWGCVLAARDMVYLFDGNSVQPIGRGIENSYFVEDGGFVTMSYIDSCIYIATGAQEFVFDLDQGNWRMEQVSDGEDGEQPRTIYNYGDVQYMGPVAGTTMSLINHRSFPGPVRGPEVDLDTTYAVSSGDLWLAGAGRVVTVRDIYFQLRQRGEGDTGLTVELTYDDGSEDTPRLIEPLTDVETPLSFRHWYQRTAKPSVSSVRLRVSQTLPAGEESCFDIEDVLIEFDRENR